MKNESEDFKMKKIWKVMSVVLCGIMLLAGCGNSASEKGNGDITEKQSAYTFSEIKKSGKLVVLFYTFCTDSDDGIPAKDSVPRGVYILENGKVYGGTFTDATFGDYSKMTDEEIKQYVIENGRKSDWYVDNVDYEIAVYTDSTGNATEYESLLIRRPDNASDPDSGSVYISALRDIYDNVTANATVYDSSYIGMSWQDIYEHRGFVWYRNNDGLRITKDTPNVEGVLVDPE